MGFVRLQLGAGNNYIANPFSRADNTVAAIFPPMPTGTTYYRFDETIGQYIPNHYDAEFGWDAPGMTLEPGLDGLLYLPSAATVSLFGEVLEGNLRNEFTPGASWLLRSPMIPLLGDLRRTLGFPGHQGDRVYILNPATQNFEVYEYDFGVWNPRSPVIPVGTSFLLNRLDPLTPREWLYQFWVPRTF